MGVRKFVVENEKREIVYRGTSAMDIVQTAKDLLYTGEQKGVCAVIIEPDGTRVRKYTACEGFIMPQQHDKQ